MNTATRALHLTALLAFLAPSLLSGESNRWLLTSPDAQCEIAISLSAEGQLRYEVARDGKVVLRSSRLGIVCDDESFDRGLQLARVGETQQRRERYELFAGVTPRVDRELNRRTLEFRNANHAALMVDLAASDEGVAFRYRFPDGSGSPRLVQAELTDFHLSPETRAWLQPYHAAGPYTPAYEDFYFHVAPGEPPPKSRGTPRGWCFPALFQVPEADTWVLLTESGTDGTYPGCHLGPDSSDGSYRIAFPLRDEHTKGQSTNAPANPRSTLPWTMPWRVIAVAKDAGGIATSTLVTDLAPASRIKNTSWIKPGRASWAWWSHPDGPATEELFDEFSDFAAKMGWEYTLFDAGWWTPGLEGIASHALKKGVAPIAWLHAADFYDPRKRSRKLDEMVAAGVRGVKVDFWCSDRQETIAAMLALFEEASTRHLVVDLHGCTIPRGWQRTWPNLLTAEAVLGTESYFYESRYPEKAAELNTVLPFTRNVAGPMDITPIGCSPKKFPRQTTAAHELAAAIIFTSGLINYADTPAFFASLPPEAQQVFREAPARWDETRCLVGTPGQLVVFARRSGAIWFVAGINGTEKPRLITLDLAPFHDFTQRQLIAEGTNAIMQVTVATTPLSDRFHHELPPRGGFILRLSQ